MPTFLFGEIIFGPVLSRRLGKSLGINLLPTQRKYCNFNCLYCECGLTETNYGEYRNELPSKQAVKEKLKSTLKNSLETQQEIDAITFAGNGEPTMHPDFAEIIDDTIALRDKYFPNASIAVLSNATLIAYESVKQALGKVEHNILKLDSAFKETIQAINCPVGNFSIDELIENLSSFRHNLTIQTLFVKGSFHGNYFDNSTPQEVNAWLALLKKIRPSQVMVYTIARGTPIDTIEKISKQNLDQIAKQVEQLGFPVSVSS